MIDENRLNKIEAIINGEDRPDDYWFVYTINELIAEIRSSAATPKTEIK